MYAGSSMQLMLILIATDSDNLIKDPVNMDGCGIVQSPRQLQTRMIVGGAPAAPGRWPWQIAVLDRRRRLICGGTLITNEFVITAAHCITKGMNVVAGEYNLEELDGSEQERRVISAYKHPDYNKDNVENDIALLKLESPLELSQQIWPACLPAQNEELKAGRMATIVGWGAVAYYKQPDGHPRVERDETLNQAKVPVVEFQECKKSYEDDLKSDQVICAGFKAGGVDSCAGDSGGPLMLQKGDSWVVYGVTSSGDECGKEGKYGIYSKTSAYVNWIKRTVSKHTASRVST